ncbi:hypothetical protein [Streptomyces sp. NPDC001380]|uniref:hypothetical protein n=1 Tax=Streptomyces sp. NPDC001380 TaxID=3364566 RepID=UPI0036804836
MGHWWYRNIVEPGKLPLLLCLLAFVLTFLATRTVTRLIRAGRGPFRNVSSGGVHIHHVVPGILLAVTGGFAAVAAPGQGAGKAAAGVVFGVGAGLVMDEFALVLHLQDVYWTEEGRRSVEMVVLTAAAVGVVLLGAVPLGVDEVGQAERADRASLVSTVAVNFLFVVAALAKGKYRLGVIGVLVPVVALVGAVRLARVDSPWAHRLYRSERKRERAAARQARHDARWGGVRRRLEDWLGGTPRG